MAARKPRRNDASQADTNLSKNFFPSLSVKESVHNRRDSRENKGEEETQASSATWAPPKYLRFPHTSGKMTQSLGGVNICLNSHL